MYYIHTCTYSHTHRTFVSEWIKKQEVGTYGKEKNVYSGKDTIKTPNLTHRKEVSF